MESESTRTEGDEDVSDNNWQADSDMIFAQISSGDFNNYADAERLVCVLYVPDMTITRAGISDALKRLERHYKAKEPTHDR
jgi:hypothetical protein